MVGNISVIFYKKGHSGKGWTNKNILSKNMKGCVFMSGRKKIDYHQAFDKLVGKPTSRETRNMQLAVHWLIDGNIEALANCDPYLWHLRCGVKHLIERADRERKKNL